ncbi:LEAF RUST 10 DISEASE-RESISTANCE LOCUS RECEPTOR-LIKE PROTEIN KINASE-like 2.2 [Tasmannia lanceolata]|uniref:LEAF RUST 10 DISEASE-RESISTANCE LOCUS RECEPTOR-LIKE PROTEIN KINASE-like 2.2 n=1 Tax=Tasmannia lanceolata TaxID=3420 RepID=UPI00406391D9
MQIKTTSSCFIFFFFFSSISIFIFSKPATSDPQTNLVLRNCSQYNSTNPSILSSNLTTVLSKIRSQLTQNLYYATAQALSPSDPVYALAQCRRYLSFSDCLSCFDTAASNLQTCSPANGGRVIYDGCCMRYDTYDFFDQTTKNGNVTYCGNRRVLDGPSFSTTVRGLVTDLCAATPRMNRYFAATPANGVYGVAQCVPTLSELGCEDCLNRACVNIQRCLPDSDARAADWGCFLRYSNKAFFTNNRSTDLSPYLDSNEGSISAKLSTGALIAIITSTLMAAVLLILFILYLKRFSLQNPISLWMKGRQNTRMVKEFLESYEALTPKRFKYSDLRKMTNNFTDKLGQGGYGGVFKGKLPDGRLVAVKVLSEAKCTGEEFINEVASIGRTSHVNIVSLLGFCFEGSKRALVYEFMPNGSLEKFIYDEKPRTLQPLGWEKLYQIALGIARGLDYLHRGCSMRILHFDIKPHNILLDQNFCPKISDFGLAKLCPTNASTVSMLGARGTAGYIAPEVYCRNFGGVSYKSDVYSYGMMILEMVGGRKNIDVTVENASEIYFPHWIYRRIDQQGDIGLGEFDTGEEVEVAKKMILVGLWCIQMEPTNRPSMFKVLELLEGSIEGLPIPPKPFPSSPLVLHEGSSPADDNVSSIIQQEG